MRPVEVTLIGQPFTVEWHDAPGPLDASRHGGGVKVIQQRIHIRNDLAPQQERETVLHELLHASMRMVGCAPEDDEVEERAVGAIAPILLDALSRDTGLRSYLFGGKA